MTEPFRLVEFEIDVADDPAKIEKLMKALEGEYPSRIDQYFGGLRVSYRGGRVMVRCHRIIQFPRPTYQIRDLEFRDLSRVVSEIFSGEVKGSIKVSDLAPVGVVYQLAFQQGEGSVGDESRDA